MGFFSTFLNEKKKKQKKKFNQRKVGEKVIPLYRCPLHIYIYIRLLKNLIYISIYTNGNTSIFLNNRHIFWE